MMPTGTLKTRALLPHADPSSRFGEVVIVAPDCNRFADFVAAGRRGEIGLHLCVDGRSALRMSRRFRADVWLVAADLPDMSGYDLVEMLLPSVARAEIDPLVEGTPVRFDQMSDTLRTAVFVVSEGYSFADEQRALRAGAAGYVTGPLHIDLLRDARQAGLRRAKATPVAFMGGIAPTVAHRDAPRPRLGS
jgi:DNA-binding response OmpR family regulator